VDQATEIYSHEFDAIFRGLPPHFRQRIEAKIRDLGRRLESYSHRRLQGRSEYRLRVGDYRIIYQFDLQRNELELVTLGHRREIYRW
jgi:mRNA interferase RelE/StbE